MTTLAPPPTADEVASDDRELSRESVVVSTWTAVSRFTGLAKLAAIGAVLGPTYMGNAFQAMNLLPTAAYEFLTGSLLVNLLVPHLTGHVRAGRAEDVERVAGRFLARAMIAFGVLIAVLMILRPLVLDVFTLGVANEAAAQAQRSAGSMLLALMLPQILLYGIAGVAGSVLNAKGRFGLVAAAPAFENAGIIATVIGAAVLYGSGVRDVAAPNEVLLVLGGGATLAVGLHAAALWIACWRNGVLLLPRLGRDAEVRDILRAAPATLGQAGLNALRTIVGLVVANAVAGGVVVFQFAMTFFYLPAALGAKAVGVPALRRLAHAFEERDDRAFAARYAHAVGLTLFLVVPAAAAYLTLAAPIVRSVAFGELATTYGIGLVVVALTTLAPGVIAEATFLLGSYASYARRDAGTPFRSMLLRTAITVYVMVVAAVFARGAALIAALGAAVALGSVVSAVHLIKAHLPFLGSAELGRSLRRTAVATTAMVATTVPTALVLMPQLRSAWTGVCVVAVGLVTYVAGHIAMRSPELAALGLRRAPDTGTLQEQDGQIVVVDPDGAVRKTYAGPDAARRAKREHDHLAAVWAATRGRTDVTCPRPLDLGAGDPPFLRMTKVAGVPLDRYLSGAALGNDSIDRIVERLTAAVRVYVGATGEPYADLHLRNALIDPATGCIAIIDFDEPPRATPRPPARALETSLGNLLGSVAFESVRPRQLLRAAFARQTLDVCRRVVERSVPYDHGAVAAVAEATLDQALGGGSALRRAWYRAMRPVAVRRMTRSMPPRSPAAVDTAPVPLPATSPAGEPLEPGEVTRLIAGALIAGALIAATVIAVVSSVVAPLAALAVVAALGFAVVVAVHPPVAAYTLLFLAPLVVGLNRSSVLPVLRVNEAIVLLSGLALVIRAIVLWALRGGPARLRLGPMETAFGVLVVTGSVLPVVWLVARGMPVTRDDFLYALVLWKLAAIYFVVRAAVRTELQVRRCVWISMISVAIVGVIGIGQSVDALGIPAFLSRFYAPEGLTAIVMNNRATSTIGNAIAFGDVMAVHAAVAAAFLLRRHRRRLTLIALGAIFSVAALASGQMSGVLALGVALATISFVTRRGITIAVAAIPVVLVAVLLLRPVVEQRLENVNPTTGVPQSWTARQENLETYFLSELREPQHVALGVRPAARVPAHEGWRDWVYIESGYVWILWTGGIPLLLAFLFFLSRGYRSAIASARYRIDGLGIAAIGAVVALAITAVLMVLDPHLTMRGTADVTFSFLALATATGGWRALTPPEAAP